MDGQRLPPSDIVVIFDTETTTDPAQRLRFGAYQVRDAGHLIDRGLFSAEDLAADDVAALAEAHAALRPTDDGERIKLLTRAEFVEQVLFGWGLDLRRPYRRVQPSLRPVLHRLRATRRRGVAFKGGFSFTMAEDRPNVRVKHLAARSLHRLRRPDGDDKHPDRGYFVDVKTLAAALTSGSHSLESLARLLGVTPKSPLDDYSGPLTPKMIAYGLNDVQVTWECFAAAEDEVRRLRALSPQGCTSSTARL